MAGTPFLFGWKVLLWAGLDAPGPVRTCFVTSDARLTYKSIPKFDFGIALCLLHASWGLWMGRTAASSVWRGQKWLFSRVWWARDCTTSVVLLEQDSSWVRWGLHVCENSNSACFGFCWTKFVTRDLVLEDLFSKSELWNSDLKLVSLGIQVSFWLFSSCCFFWLIDELSVLFFLAYFCFYKRPSWGGGFNFNNGRQKDLLKCKVERIFINHGR